MSNEPKEQVERGELEEQDGELLPDREAMSIITPGFDRAVPVDAIAPEPPISPD